MPEQVAKINAAIRACLARCYVDKSPLNCVGDFLQALRTDPAWSEAEIEEVRAAVLKMLSMIVKKPTDD